MIKIELRPLIGIFIDGIGEILLGDNLNKLKSLLGEPSHIFGHQVHYEGYEVRFDVDANANIEFIEFIYGPFPQLTELSIYGIDPFKIGAENLVDILTQHNGGEIDGLEAPYCYVFLNTSVGIWRDAIPEIVETDLAAGDDFDEELAKARNFWTIGLGVKGYYR